MLDQNSIINVSGGEKKGVLLTAKEQKNKENLNLNDRKKVIQTANLN